MPKTRKYQKSNRKTRKTNKTNKTRNKRIKKIKAKKTLKKQMLGGNGRKGRIDGTTATSGKKVMLKYNGDGVKQLEEEEGLSELHTACRDGDIATVQRLLLEDPKVDVNEITPENHMTPLYIASLMNHVEIVKELLEQPEIDVTLSTTYGEWSFSVAIKKNHKEVADLIKKRIAKNHQITTKFWRYFFPPQPAPETVYNPLIINRKN